MEIGDLAEYKELMAIAKEQGNTEEYRKFYEFKTNCFIHYYSINTFYFYVSRIQNFHLSFKNRKAGKSICFY